MLIGYSHALCHHCPSRLCRKDRIVDQSLCGWFCVYIPLLIVNRVSSSTKDTRMEEWQHHFVQWVVCVLSYGALCQFVESNCCLDNSLDQLSMGLLWLHWIYITQLHCLKLHLVTGQDQLGDFIRIAFLILGLPLHLVPCTPQNSSCFSPHPLHSPHPILQFLFSLPQVIHKIYSISPF